MPRVVRSAFLIGDLLNGFYQSIGLIANSSYMGQTKGNSLAHDSPYLHLTV